jgi:alcohol dehydrogenase class IV
VESVDALAAEMKHHQPDAIIAVGGGSVIDTGKAVSAMVPSEGSIQDYLEGVGDKTPNGEKVPLYAAPTTAGTGTETTKNAVISKVGEGGFKKSLRHDNYVPDVAVVDPELTRSCPMDVTAASGMDAITQLLEAFVSTTASPMTDALVMTGLMTAGRSFERAVKAGDSDIEARKDMSYAATMSGLGLANAGLGIVHGFASSIGGMHPIPHGTVCGTLLSAATEVIIDKLFNLEEENNTALLKYAEAGKYLSLRDYGTVDDNCKALVDILARWTEEFSLDRLGTYGITEADIPLICDKTGRKNTPVDLDTEDLVEILTARI